MQALKALVIGMGVLIVVGFVFVFATIIMRAGGGVQDSAALDEMHLELSESCVIAQIVEVNRMLALRLEGPARDGCGQILLIDPGAGEVSGRVHPGSAPESD